MKTYLEPDTLPPFVRIRQGAHWVQCHANDLKPIAEAIIDGLEVWAQDRITSSTEIVQIVVTITAGGKVRISKPLRGGRGGERWMIIPAADAIDLAEEMLSQ